MSSIVKWSGSRSEHSQLSQLRAFEESSHHEDEDEDEGMRVRVVRMREKKKERRRKAQ